MAQDMRSHSSSLLGIAEERCVLYGKIAKEASRSVPLVRTSSLHQRNGSEQGSVTGYSDGESREGAIQCIEARHTGIYGCSSAAASLCRDHIRGYARWGLVWVHIRPAMNYERLLSTLRGNSYYSITITHTIIRALFASCTGQRVERASAPAVVG